MEKSDFDSVLEAISGAALLCSEEGDFISFVTVLDYHLSDWGVYTSGQRIELLELVIETLNKDDELMEEIGWDLPAMVFPFVDQDWPLNVSLKKQPFIKVFWKFCDLMARKGQPKELLLSCCELLSTLEDPIEITRETIPEELSELDRLAFAEQPLKCFSLKFHALLQIITSCLVRNETIYPSKFLSKVVVSIINFYKIAPNISHHNIVVRRIHGFIRDYVPPNIPAGALEESTEEVLMQLSEDEAYLQRKLLIFLLALTAENFYKANAGFMIQRIYPKFSVRGSHSQIQPTVELSSLLYALAVSLDLDIPGLLYREVKSMNEAFDCKTNGELKTSEEIFKHVIDVYNCTYLREKSPSTLPISPSTLLCLFIHGKYIENAKCKVPGELNVMEIIKFQLQLFLPYTIDPKLSNISSVFCSIVWLMSIIQNDIPKCHELLSNPENKLLINTSLQSVSGVLINSGYVSLRKFLLVYLVKILKTLPEEQSWEFIFDSLIECPYESFVIDSINILKDLIKKDRYSVDELITSINGVKIEETPSLPPRSPKKFITFNDERKSEIIKLFDVEIGQVFDNGKRFQSKKANKLLSYINFINSVEFDKEVVKERIDKITKYVENFKDTKNESDRTVIALIEFAISNTVNIYQL